MKLTIFKLKFDSPLHIGNYREDYEQSNSYIRSDTLYAAVIATWAKIGMKIPETGDPGFTISSLFPYTSDTEGKDVFFLPKISLSFPYKGDTVGIAKKLKKVNWVDYDYFEKQINPANTFSSFGRDNDHLKGEFCTSKKIDKKFISKQVLPRVTVPRNIDDSSGIFYMERIRFTEGSGLYFMFKATDDQKEKLYKTLEILGREGIGTDRTVGNGYFTPLRPEEITITFPRDTEYAVNISLFYPESMEQLKVMLDKNARYDLVKRGGWITTAGFNTYRKKSVYMFAEGSVFKTGKNGIKEMGCGSIDLTPKIMNEHKIFRNGRSLFIPVKIRNDD